MNLLIPALMVAISLGFGFGYKVATGQSNAAHAKALIQAQEQYNAITQQYHTASSQLEAVIARRRTQSEETTRTVEKIVERPVYRNVCLDDDGLRAANAALGGSTTPSEPNDSVP